MAAVTEDLIELRELLAAAPLVDGHNDLLWEMRDQAGYDFDRIDIAARVATTQTDIPRLRAGGVGAQFWSVFVPSDLPGDTAVTATLEQLDAWRAMVARYPDDLMLALGADDVRRAAETGRIASLAGMEGGQSIGASLGALRMMYALGARYMTLTHNDNNPWADSATDEPAHDGLTAFGEEVVREMNRLGMLVDLSHVAPTTMHDALRVSESPVVFSHSSARALCDHPRNVPDDVLTQLAANRGVCMVTFVPGFVSETVSGVWRDYYDQRRRLRAEHPDDEKLVEAEMHHWELAHPDDPVTVEQVADHVDHVRDVAGIEHVGVGGDYDGVPKLPVGLEDVSTYPVLFAELRRRGYSDADLQAVAGRNALRVLGAAEAVARDLQTVRGPSLARIGDLDAPPQPSDQVRPAQR
ncbi:MAG: rane dipeptidase [Actinomycetota bacterium]|nr:rane dipeptidase [Actinomycetota bacterium]